MIEIPQIESFRYGKVQQGNNLSLTCFEIVFNCFRVIAGLFDKQFYEILLHETTKPQLVIWVRSIQ